MNTDDKPCQATPSADLRQQIMDSRVPKNEREWWASRTIEKLETELAAATKRIDDCEFLLAHRYKIIERQEPRIKEAVARAERAEAEVERLKGMRTAAEAIMTDVAEANEELAIARAEKAEAEAQLWHNRFASILWSGALNKHTGGDFQKWEAEFKAEQNALIARAEKAEVNVEQLTKHCSALEVEVAVLSEGLSEDHAIYIANARAEKAEASLHDLSLDLSTANHMIKLERDRADALQTRLNEINAMLKSPDLDLIRP